MSRPNWFVALPVSIEHASARVPDRVTVLDPRDHHVTLAFLGAVDEAAAMAGWDATSLTLAARDVRLGEVLALGPPRRPSAITVRVDDDGVREAIASCRDAICDAAGARRDERDALPHVTLARISPRASRSDRDAALAWARSLGLEGRLVRIDRVALYTKAIERGARRYRMVAERPLG